MTDVNKVKQHITKLESNVSKIETQCGEAKPSDGASLARTCKTEVQAGFSQFIKTRDELKGHDGDTVAGSVWHFDQTALNCTNDETYKACFQKRLTYFKTATDTLSATSSTPPPSTNTVIVPATGVVVLPADAEPTMLDAANNDAQYKTALENWYGRNADIIAGSGYRNDLEDLRRGSESFKEKYTRIKGDYIANLRRDALVARAAEDAAKALEAAKLAGRAQYVDPPAWDDGKDVDKNRVALIAWIQGQAEKTHGGDVVKLIGDIRGSSGEPLLLNTKEKYDNFVSYAKAWVERKNGGTVKPSAGATTSSGSNESTDVSAGAEFGIPLGVPWLRFLAGIGLSVGGAIPATDDSNSELETPQAMVGKDGYASSIVNFWLGLKFVPGVTGDSVSLKIGQFKSVWGVNVGGELKLFDSIIAINPEAGLNVWKKPLALTGNEPDGKEIKQMYGKLSVPIKLGPVTLTPNVSVSGGVGDDETDVTLGYGGTITFEKKAVFSSELKVAKTYLDVETPVLSFAPGGAILVAGNVVFETGLPYLPTAGASASWTRSDFSGQTGSAGNTMGGDIDLEFSEDFIKLMATSELAIGRVSFPIGLGVALLNGEPSAAFDFGIGFK